MRWAPTFVLCAGLAAACALPAYDVGPGAVGGGGFGPGGGESGGSGATAPTGGTGGDGGLGESRPWLAASYAYRKPLLLDTSGVGEDLENFPAPIVLTDEDIGTFAQSNGRDIAFTLADGVTVLSHELELYEDEPPQLVAWVRLPVVTEATETELYVYFGDENESGREDVFGTWPTPEFRGVWHLGENPDGPGKQMKDSTEYDSHGRADFGPGSADGIAAAALSFDGSAARVRVDQPADGHLDPGDLPFSYSCWVFGVDALPSGRPIYKWDGNPGGSYLTLGPTGWQARTAYGSDEITTTLWGPFPKLNEWIHLATVIDREAGFQILYIDAIVAESVSITQPDGMTPLDAVMTGEDLIFSPGGGSFNGRIDEVRFYGQALSASWVELEHRALSAPGFVVVGELDSF